MPGMHSLPKPRTKIPPYSWIQSWFLVLGAHMQGIHGNMIPKPRFNLRVWWNLGSWILGFGGENAFLACRMHSSPKPRFSLRVWWNLGSWFLGFGEECIPHTFFHIPCVFRLTLLRFISNSLSIVVASRTDSSIILLCLLPRHGDDECVRNRVFGRWQRTGRYWEMFQKHWLQPKEKYLN